MDMDKIKRVEDQILADDELIVMDHDNGGCNMIIVKVDGDSCRIHRYGKVNEISQEYLKVIITLIESLSVDADVNRKDVLTYLYDTLSNIYDDNETIIKMQ